MGELSERLWRRLRALLDYLESAWQEPDDGMWEARGPRRHYTQSKVMAWLAFDRAIALSKRFDLESPLRRWEQVRAQIHEEILERAYDPQRRTFTQSYLPAGIHPSRPDRRGQSPQRRADGDPIRAPEPLPRLPLPASRRPAPLKLRRPG